MKPRTVVNDRGRVDIYRRGLDEVVIRLHEKESADCIHLEQLDTKSWFLGVGASILNVRVMPDGKLKLTIIDHEGRR